MAYNKEYYQKNKIKMLKSHKRYCDLNREEVRRYNKEHQREWRKNHPEKQIQRRIKQYNLLYDNWVQMWKDQDGKCKICRRKFLNPSDSCVDHNHKTGKVRGLLCDNCNHGIGCFDDNTKLMIKAIDYLLEEK